MIDTEKLRHALAVAREGSFVAGAAAIPLSQSALSRSIQSLEREFEIRIFDRSRAGARLTPEGGRFLNLADSLVRHADATEIDLRRIVGNSAAPTSFGISAVAAASYLPDFVKGLLSRPPDGKVRIRIGPSRQLHDLLRKAEVDFYVAALAEGSDSFQTADNFTVKRIVHASDLALLVRSDHPLTTHPLPEHELQDYPIVAGTYMREFASTSFEDLRLQEPLVEVDDYELLLSLVRSSDAILVANSVLTDRRMPSHVVTLPVQLKAAQERSYALVSSIGRPLRGETARLADALAAVMVAGTPPVEVASGVQE